VGIADLAVATWDGVVVLGSADRDAGAARDRVIRAVLSRLPPASS
jgi:hypothetical protein